LARVSSVAGSVAVTELARSWEGGDDDVVLPTAVLGLAVELPTAVLGLPGVLPTAVLGRAVAPPTARWNMTIPGAADTVCARARLGVFGVCSGGAGRGRSGGGGGGRGVRGGPGRVGEGASPRSMSTDVPSTFSRTFTTEMECWVRLCVRGWVGDWVEGVMGSEEESEAGVRVGGVGEVSGERETVMVGREGRWSVVGSGSGGGGGGGGVGVVGGGESWVDWRRRSLAANLEAREGCGCGCGGGESGGCCWLGGESIRTTCLDAERKHVFFGRRQRQKKKGRTAN
jgi:hypothetical protein